MMSRHPLLHYKITNKIHSSKTDDFLRFFGCGIFIVR